MRELPLKGKQTICINEGLSAGPKGSKSPKGQKGLTSEEVSYIVRLPRGSLCNRCQDMVYSLKLVFTFCVAKKARTTSLNA